MNRIRRATLIAGMVAALAWAGALPAAAQPTCADFDALDVEVHGQHIVRDYVAGGGAAGEWPPKGGGVGKAVAGEGAAVPGGPGPGFHFPNEFAAGASFCLSQSQSPGWHVADDADEDHH